MRKMVCKSIFIFWTLLLTQLISECFTSGLDNKSEHLREVGEIKVEQEGSGKLVPTHLIREYGYYILSNNGFSSNLLICEFESENLQLKYTNFASKLAKVTSKLLLNIKLTNSILYSLYNKVFGEISNLESIISEYHYFLKLQDIYEQLKLFKNSESAFNEEVLESEIEESLNHLSKIINSLAERNGQRKKDFCLSLYLFRFKGIRQFVLVIRGLLLLIRTGQISEISTQLDTRFNKIFGSITKNLGYLGVYKSTLFEINAKLEETFLGCLDAIGNLSIPLFGGESQDNQLLNIISTSFKTFGNDSFKMSAKDFGAALDEIAENRILYRMNCELRISKVKDFLNSQKIKLNDSFNILRSMLQELRSFPIDYEIQAQKYVIFKEYSNSMQNDTQLFNKIADQINLEHLRGLVIFISEFQVQLQERCLSLMEAFDFSELKGSFLWWNGYFNFALSENKFKENKLSELSRILDLAISSLVKVNSIESKVVNLLSLELFSKYLKDYEIEGTEFLLEYINKVQKYSKSIMLYNSYYMNYDIFMRNRHLDADISNSMPDSTQNIHEKRQYDESCKALRAYFDKIANDERVSSALNNIDKMVYFEVQEYRRELEKLHENMSSANILFITSIGYNDQYNLIFELIENLVVGETNFEAYISNYLEIRNCIGHVNSDFRLTSITPSAIREGPENRIFLDPVKDKLLKSRDLLMMKFDVLLNKRIISSIESVFEMYLDSQIYLSGSLSQMLRFKETPEMPLTRYDFNLLYNIIVRAENLLFKSKGLKPTILPEDKLKERVSFLYSIYSSYVQQISNFKNYIAQWNDNMIKESTLSHGDPTNFISLLDSSLGSITRELIQMFERGSLNKNVEREVLEGIETLFLCIKSQEFQKLLDKLDTIYKSENLIELITNGKSISLSQQFIDRVKSITVLDNELIGLKMEDKMPPWSSHISASDYPASIKLKKENIKITHSGLDSGCTVAYLDKIESQYKQFDRAQDNNFDKTYNVVVVHCRINNVPGETISDFLKRRAQIKDSGSVTLPEFVAKQIDEDFHLHYLAVDFSLKNSLETIKELEAKINQLFILIPGLHVDYFLNLDMLIILGDMLIINLNKDIIRKTLSSLITYYSELDTSTFFFLYKSKVLVLEFPLDKNGKITRIRTLGKYSGFGGETPVSFAIVDKREFQQDSSHLDKIQKGLFQKVISNYVPIYKNLAPLSSSNKSIREFAWIVSERSHILYMMLLRSGIEKFRSESKELDLIYPVADEGYNELQISFVNPFFNSITRRRSLNNLFYDVTKNKLIILNNSDNMHTRSVNVDFLEFTSSTQLFINMSLSLTGILDVPVYESDISQAIESYLSGSMPLFCSSRRNYYDNSILLNINKHFSYSELIPYRLLINVINPKVLLKVRNLPSQYALRRIFNFGKELLLDFEKLRISYNLPITDINDNSYISMIRKNMELSLKRMIQSTAYSQLEKFPFDISPELLGYKIIIPGASNKSIIKSGDEVFQLNGVTYFVVRYSEENMISALSTLIREVLNGRLNIVFVANGFDLKLLKPSDLSSGNNPSQVHLMKRVPIEFVPNERLVRIYTNTYDAENMQLVYDIMSLYQGFDLSIVTKHEEYYYFSSLCWDSNNGTPKYCSYIQVFRYLRSSIFEKLKLYQSSLNKNISLSLIAEEGEILSLDFIGLSVVSRFKGSVLFKSGKYYELFYESEQYWDLCSFVQEFYKFSTEFSIKAVNYDPKIKDIIFEPDFSECPIPEIPNLNIYSTLPRFIAYNNDPQGPGFTFTLYNSIRYLTLSILINYFLSEKKIFIRHEGIEDVSAPESILEILGYFEINMVKDSSVISIFLNEISLKVTEVESAKIVRNQIRSIIPNATIVGINIRGEYIF
ncbi:uncharacterized protein ELE39_001755 [Cryptosporidium sp. chipmunk genotype I]|uniref:uncharacterized protein n=1 Tax=Cryptosporidium sp. chipmunk genotype I TaxID=1280935 RepID=UPI003519F728|nr:hypothetical protein ELE39_001755 [Cryptosporidium sp. chipmunk genotype I]